MSYLSKQIWGVSFGDIVGKFLPLPEDMKPATVVTFNNALLGGVSFLSSWLIGLKLAETERLNRGTVIERTIPAIVGLGITTAWLAKGE